MNVLHQTEVGDFHAFAYQQQVFRFDVQVLQRMPLAHEVQGVGRVVEELQQRFARNPRLAFQPAGVEVFLQAALGQFGDDDELAVHHLDALQRQQEGVPDFLHAIQGLEFSRGPRLVEFAVDEFQRLDESAGSVRGPDFAVAAGADTLAHAIAWNRLSRFGRLDRHGSARLVLEDAMNGSR